MPELFGQLPHPRILILGFESDREFVAHVRRLAPTVRLIGAKEMFSIRQEEWDAIVTRGEPAGHRGVLNVFQVGGKSIGVARIADTSPVHVQANFTTTATHFMLPDDLNSDIRTLTRNDLLPRIQARSTNAVWGFHSGSSSDYPRITPQDWGAIEPFLMTADKNVLAGRIFRGEKETWWLPEVGCDLARWFSVAIELWSLRDPDTFPVREEWKKRDAWKTPTEKALHSELAKVRTDLTATIRRLEEEESKLSLTIDEVALSVDTSERRLLTAQGDDLVEQVEKSLAELGFTVENADKNVSTAGDRREDLRVTDPTAPGWTAIVEVRGYARGAQLNDLLRLGRFVTRFVRETGGEPSSVWYVVNQEIKKDPDTRQSPLASNRDEVATFAETGGAVIDTRQVFQLLMQCRTQKIGQDEARRLLREARGAFSL